MELDRAALAHLAELACLKLSPEEEVALQEDLNRLLGFFERLRELNLQEPPPGEQQGRLRPDLPEPSLNPEEVLRSAPSTHEGYFQVPRTLEES
jgi:aspartyl-tRNA(Asn)/glutamyl-tRNA(Gln) amidotransferase subunit C